MKNAIESTIIPLFQPNRTIAASATKAIEAWRQADLRHSQHDRDIAADRIYSLSEQASWQPAESAADALFKVSSIYSLLDTIANLLDEDDYKAHRTVRAAIRLTVLSAQYIEAITDADRVELGYDYMMCPSCEGRHFGEAI